MKVWVLTSGQYSDVGIEGIFTNLEKIKEYKESVKKIQFKYLEDIYGKDFMDMYYERDYNDPYEVNLDQEIPKNLYPYSIGMKTDGTITSISLSDYPIFKTSTQVYKKGSPIRKQVDFYVYCMARDKDHAIKIAGDERRKLIMNNLL